MDADDAGDAPLMVLEFGDGGTASAAGWQSQRVVTGFDDGVSEARDDDGDVDSYSLPLSMTQVRRPLPLPLAGGAAGDDSDEETDEWDSSSGSSDSSSDDSDDDDDVDIVEDEVATAQRSRGVVAAVDDDVVVIVDDEDGDGGGDAADGIENRAPAVTAAAAGALVSPPPSARNAAVILMASARQHVGAAATGARRGSGSGKASGGASDPRAAPAPTSSAAAAASGSGGALSGSSILSGRRGQLTLGGTAPSWSSSSSSSAARQSAPPRASSTGANTGGAGAGGGRTGGGRVANKRSSGGAFSSAATASSTSSSRPLPFYKVLPRTGIVVDGFAFSPGAYKHFILTHFHSDHYGGLTKHWSAGTIYCTPVTAALVALRLGVSPRFLHPIPLDTPTLINGCTVTLVDANHCPGAAMVHLQLPPPAPSNHSNGACYLHVGDFRWTRRMTRHPLLAGARAAARGVAPPPVLPAPMASAAGHLSLPSSLPAPLPSWSSSASSSVPASAAPVSLPLPLPRRIDCLYLDTTYADPTYAFPPQEACVQAVVQTATYYARDPHVLLLFGSYAIGKERVFLEVARALGPTERIYVDRVKYRALQCCDLPPEDARRLTTDPSLARIHVVPMGYLTLGRLHDRLKALTAQTAAGAPQAATPALKRPRASAQPTAAAVATSPMVAGSTHASAGSAAALSSMLAISTPVTARATVSSASGSRGGGIAGTGISRSNKRTTLRGAGFASLLAASATAATSSSPAEGTDAVTGGAAQDEDELAALMAERDGTRTRVPAAASGPASAGASTAGDGGVLAAATHGGNAFDELMRSAAAQTVAGGSGGGSAAAPAVASACGPYHSIVAFKPTGWSHAAAVGGSSGGAHRGKGDDLAPGDTSDVLSVQARVTAAAAVGAWSRQAGAEDAARQAAPSVVAAARDAAVAVADIVEERRAGAVQALVAVPQDELMSTQAAAAAAAGWRTGIAGHAPSADFSTSLRGGDDHAALVAESAVSVAPVSASSAGEASSMALLELITGARGRAAGTAAGFDVASAGSASVPAAAAASVVVHTVRMTRQCRAGGAKCRARPPLSAAAAAAVARRAQEAAASQVPDGAGAVSGHKRPAPAEPPGGTAGAAATGALAPGGVTLFSVPYSEHSSFVELRECVAWLDPVTIIPTVNCRSKEDADALVALLRGGGEVGGVRA